MEELPAGAGMGVASLVEHVGPVCDLQTAPGVLLDHDDRHPGVGDLADPFEDEILGQRCQAGRRLIQQQHRGIHHQRPADGDHLALAT